MSMRVLATYTYGVTDSTASGIKPGLRTFFQNLIGPHTFNLVSLSLASLVFSLGRVTVYAADGGDFFIYSLCAIAISQSLVIVLLSFLGKIVIRISWTKLLAPLAVISILLVNILGTVAFETMLRSWNLDPIPQSWFQRIISLFFTVFIYLGFGQVLMVLRRDLAQMDLAKGLLAGLSKQQIELTEEIRESRTFSMREISLEIQSTLGTLENYSASNSPDQNLVREIDNTRNILKATEIQINEVKNRFPGPVRMSKLNSKVRHSLSSVISASTKPNEALPVVISIVAFFGFCSWLSYFMDEFHAAFWGSALSILSFGIFFGYEKYIATKLVTQSVVIRIFAFETFIVTYLFFWLLILGYFAGDNSTSYGAALAYAAIPFIFFNGGAVLGGVITSSQEQREQLTKQATTLRNELAELEQIRDNEDKVWKSLFAGDISLSPTTANVILRDATKTKEHDLVVSVMTNVNAAWKSVSVKLSSVTLSSVN